MKVLFDQGTPAPLRRAFAAHVVATAFEQGWAALQNGALLGAAEEQGFELFVTTDKNLRYQQDLAARRIAILVLWTTSWPDLRPHAAAVAAAGLAMSEGEYRELRRPT